MKHLLSLLLGSSALLGSFACGETTTPLADRGCPCADGFTCCSATNQCVANGQACGGPSPNATSSGSSAVSAPPGDLANVPTLPAKASDGKLRVFVSTAFHDGNFGGLAGADAFCRKAANDVGLGGKWVAFLAGSKSTIAERIQGDGPWYLADGTSLVYANHDALGSDPRSAIDQDEAGRKYDPAYVWLGPAIDVPYLLDTCSDWTSSTGQGAFVYAGVPVANITNDDCATKHNLICFEQK